VIFATFVLNNVFSIWLRISRPETFGEGLLTVRKRTLRAWSSK
jgi:hypothetical protein